jgi:chloramphenicol 3-O phosphotransferase
VARAREALRQDRVPGMAELQAAVVHEGVVYDLTVDTSHASPESCATTILARVATKA